MALYEINICKKSLTLFSLALLGFKFKEISTICSKCHGNAAKCPLMVITLLQTQELKRFIVLVSIQYTFTQTVQAAAWL